MITRDALRTAGAIALIGGAMLFPVGLAVTQFAAGPSPAGAFQDPGATIPTPGVTTTTPSPTTSVGSTGSVPSAAGPIADATTLAEIQASREYNQSEHEDILRLYAAFFGRAPDARGARYWIADIYEGQGAGLDVIAFQFAASDEFRNTYGSVDSEEYLRILYRNVLLRDPDEKGFQYWLGFLNDGQLNRGSVVRWVAAGVEFESRVQFPDLTP